MKQFIVPILMLCAVSNVQAQSFTLNDLETLFKQNNTQLLAAKYNIDQAQAAVIQEKLWPNPTLSISEVNLWKTHNIQQQAYLFGKYGQYQQVAVELEQLIETAGKRKKRVALKQLDQNDAAFDYEEILRELRKDLRLAYYHLYRIHQEAIQLNEIVLLYTNMKEQYKRQADLQNIATASLYRVQTELINLKQEKVALENERIDALGTLRILTHLPNLDLHQIEFLEPMIDGTQKIPNNLIQIAQSQNIGLKRQEIERQIAQKMLALQKAQKTPDIRLQLNYDRGGNIMTDFVGVGMSVDLPVFNQNKGNIKAAAIEVQQQDLNKFTVENNLTQTVIKLEHQLTTIAQTLQQWPTQQLADQKLMLDNYHKHLLNKQVTLLEFLDYTQAYRAASKTYVTLQQNYLNTLEEIQYIVGQDFK